MTKQTLKPGAGLQEQIKDLEVSLERVIRNEIQKDIKKTGISPIEILGELVWPFVGLDSPVYYSFPQDGDASGSDIVIQDIIVHFANKENLKDWPDTYGPEILTTLHHLLKTVETIRKHSNLLYHMANLHQLKQRSAETLHFLDLFDTYRIDRPSKL